jgi:hypothetical protein
LGEGADYDTQILSLAYKEGKAIIKFEAAPRAKAENDKR